MIGTFFSQEQYSEHQSTKLRKKKHLILRVHVHLVLKK